MQVITSLDISSTYYKLLRACSVVPERAQELFLLMMVIQINKAIRPEIYAGGHSEATKHALRVLRIYKHAG